jgi:hypothetical protein
MESASTASRPPIQRIAVTVPPHNWFHGIARALYDHYRQALVELGLKVFDVPVDAFLPPDMVRISALIVELKAFQPQFALGLSHGSYALLCGLPAHRDGWRPNLFLDVLDIPTICLWDHAPVELADQLLLPHPQEPSTSEAGARERLRRVLTHPRLIHWSRDSGQTRIMSDLGFLLPHRVFQEMPPMLPGFSLPPRSPLPASGRANVAFVGRLYQEPPNHPHPALAALADDTIHAWLGAPEQPLWDALGCQIARLPVAVRRQLALDHDRTYFWHFAHRLIVHQAQTSLRLNLLGSAGVPVACYGNLQTDLRGVPENLLAVPGSVTFGPQLAEVFARHAITIDVLNPGFVQGYSHKQIHGFTAGGFMLLNRKQDYVDAFGEPGEAVSFTDGDDLRAKVERFLAHPKLRLEVGDAIRQTVAARFQLNDVLSRALQAAFHCAETTGSNPNAPLRRPSDHGVKVMDLLPGLRTQAYWSDARVQQQDRGALLSTPARAWAYAASIDIPPMVTELNEPHVRVSLIVEAGRIGIAALRDDTRALVGEQVVSPSGQPVTVTVELPRQGAATVIFRNTVETTSRAVILEASLCDRQGSKATA